MKIYLVNVELKTNIDVEVVSDNYIDVVFKAIENINEKTGLNISLSDIISWDIKDVENI